MVDWADVLAKTVKNGHPEILEWLIPLVKLGRPVLESILTQACENHNLTLIKMLLATGTRIRPGIVRYIRMAPGVRKMLKSAI